MQHALGWSWLAVLAVGCGAAAPPATSPSPAPRRITLLSIADTHAHLETHPEYVPGASPEIQPMGGFARLKTAIDRVRATAGAPVFVADGGDTFQGTAAAAWSRGEAVVAPFNGLGLDVCVPGNWEVVYGPERFRELMHELTCQVTVYNFHDAATGARLFAPSVTLDRGGVRVAFVGITDPYTTVRQSPDEVAGLDTSRIAGLRDFVRDLRARSHPDLVVAVTHTGLTVSRRLAREIPELDVVLSGHTHERTLHEILEGHVIVVEPGSMGSFLGRLDLTLAPGGGVAAHHFELMPIRPADVPEDPAERRLVDAALAPYRERAAEVLGYTDVPILRYDVLETNADDLIADAVREAAGADLGFTNGFRFGTPIPAGPITEDDLWNLLPLDARLKLGWVTGRELHAYLEHELELVFSADPWKLSGGWGPRASGLDVTFAAGAPPGQRVRSLTVGGRPLADDARYTMAGCERAGEELDIVCRLHGAHDVHVLPLTVHQVMRAYLHAHPHVAPRRDGRARAVDLPTTVLSQDAVLQGFGSTSR